MWLYIIIAIVIILILFVFITQNSLIKLDNKVEEAFSTMDIYLKKRQMLFQKDLMSKWLQELL